MAWKGQFYSLHNPISLTALQQDATLGIKQPNLNSSKKSRVERVSSDY